MRQDQGAWRMEERLRMGDPRHLRDLGRSQGVHFTFPFLWILSKIIPRHLHPVLSIHNSHCRAYGEYSCYENLMRAGGYFKLRCLVWPFTTTRTCSVLLPRFNVQKTGSPDLEAWGLGGSQCFQGSNIPSQAKTELKNAATAT